MRFRRQYTLFQRTRNGKKYWYFRIYLPDGTRKAKSTGCRSKEKAICYVETLLDNESKLRVVFEADIKQSAKNSKGLGSGSITPLKTFENIILFSDFAEGWWEWDSCPYVLDRRSAGTEEHPGIKKKYVDQCRYTLKKYLVPYFGSMLLAEITPETISEFMRVLKEIHGLKPKTINNIRCVLLVMLNDAKQKKLIQDNPVEATVVRRVEKKKKRLITDEEWSMLFGAGALDAVWDGNILYYAFSFAASLTGLRAGELLALTIDDITASSISVTKSWNGGTYGMGTTKNSDTRTIPITRDLFLLLYQAFASHEPGSKRFIFSLNGDVPLNSQAPRNAFYKALERIGISEAERKDRGIDLHAWRHRFTTECVKANMHPEAIRALTGHRTPEMLSVYTDLDPTSDLAESITRIQRGQTNLVMSSLQKEAD